MSEVESRSVQRRKAAAKGEPAPTFSQPGLVSDAQRLADLRAALSRLADQWEEEAKDEPPREGIATAWRAQGVTFSRCAAALRRLLQTEK
jgi:hypothetical protein